MRILGFDPAGKLRTFSRFAGVVALAAGIGGCTDTPKGDAVPASPVRLIVLAPGHFHAALLQKYANKDVDRTVYVYAPAGPEVNAYLQLIDQYNSRKETPTAWKEVVRTGPGFLDSLLAQKPGNVVVIAGNNRQKSEYIRRSVAAGLNVLADKPMAINPQGFEQLRAALAEAKARNLLLYDIMTERYVFTNILQRDLSLIPGIFGTLELGTEDKPSVVFSSRHYFFKEVSGQPLTRPDWYFDVDQQGEGIVDVTVHMVDLVQWECFPGADFDYKRDVAVCSARRWPTMLKLSQFREVTGDTAYPAFLRKDVKKDSLLSVYANGEMNYTLKSVHARVSVIWDFEAPPGSDDTFCSVLTGSRATLTVRQDAAEHYKPVLYIEPAGHDGTGSWEQALRSGISQLAETYPGISLQKAGKGWAVQVPARYNKGHEQHFSLVVNQFLDYLKQGKMPAQEISALLTKYYTTTQSLEKALGRP
jgi:predicted dehydrogenase